MGNITWDRQTKQMVEDMKEQREEDRRQTTGHKQSFTLLAKEKNTNRVMYQSNRSELKEEGMENIFFVVPSRRVVNAPYVSTLLPVEFCVWCHFWNDSRFLVLL